MASTIEGLYDPFADRFKEITVYSRVMVCDFHPDGHGQVVNEAGESHLVHFLRLHYPVADIPKASKRLFLVNGSEVGFRCQP